MNLYFWKKPLLKEISSLQNPLVKQIVELKSKSSKRREHELCIIEGKKEIEIAIESGIQIESLLVDINSTEMGSHFQDKVKEVFLCSSQIMAKVALRQSTNSLVAIAKTKYSSLNDIKVKENPFILILENIEKPGNLGSLFRTSDAADIDLILCTEMQTDLYNPNVIRNSLGCVFSKPIIYCTNKEALEFCKMNNVLTYATFLHTESYYYQKDFKKPTAIIFGTESTGISPFWQEAADALLVRGEKRQDLIVGAYLVDIALGDDKLPRPTHFREKFRLYGPSVDYLAPQSLQQSGV